MPHRHGPVVTAPMACQIEHCCGQIMVMGRPKLNLVTRIDRYQAKLIAVRSEGNRRVYRVQAERMAELAALLDRFWGDKLARLQEEISGIRPKRQAR